MVARGQDRKPVEDRAVTGEDRNQARKNDEAHFEPNRTTLGGVWTRVAARLRAELGEDLYSSWFARMERMNSRPSMTGMCQLTVARSGRAWPCKWSRASRPFGPRT